ncbi:DUF2442 domain-containing protein [uncultured Thiohalocapsa sp.]|uniref:DUF2442 domain-containing protein n=1 Tax=uncultured Thiohalocapsa sp. TaxID=768990 RepID=UPI0025DD2BDE|nr:DUF2442 domain-containing protein [uncultured Thiohalocapsa sp.]
MYPAVTSVDVNEDFTLSLGFSTGASGTLDMKPYLDFGVFRRLRDLDAFRTAHVAFDTVAWEGGIDLDPEFVYRKCKCA